MKNTGRWKHDLIIERHTWHMFIYCYSLKADALLCVLMSCNLETQGGDWRAVSSWWLACLHWSVAVKGTRHCLCFDYIAIGHIALFIIMVRWSNSSLSSVPCIWCLSVHWQSSTLRCISGKYAILSESRQAFWLMLTSIPTCEESANWLKRRAYLVHHFTFR